MAPAAMQQHAREGRRRNGVDGDGRSQPDHGPREQDGVPHPDGHPEPREPPERRRVDAADLIGVPADQHPVRLDLRDDAPEPQGLEIGVPGLHGGLDPVEVTGEIRRCSYRCFSHSACSPP